MALLQLVYLASGLSAADESEWTSRAYRQVGYTPFTIDDANKRARAKATGRSEVLGGSKTSRNILDNKNTGGVRKINKSATKAPSAAAAAKKPTAKVVAKQKNYKKKYHFCSRGYL